MPNIAIGDEKGSVDTFHTCTCCDPTTTTNECSETVFVGGTGVVTFGDNNTSHDEFSTVDSNGNDVCVSHSVTLSEGSETVFVDGKQVGREGDKYGAEEITSAGQTSVLAG